MILGDSYDYIIEQKKVFEEIGFDVSGCIDPNNFVEKRVGKRNIYSFIISNISEDIKFKLSKKEIDVR